jgi:hypothetical protein
MINRVVVRYANGRMLKGQTNDFFPNKPVFHLETNPSEKGQEVEIKDLKAVFFVRELGGDPTYQKTNEFPPQALSGRKVEVTFSDGEIIAGTTLGYDPSRPGFFLIPADPNSNNLRIFVVAKAVGKFRYL